MSEQYGLMGSEQLLEIYNFSNTASSIHCGEEAVIQTANLAMLRIWGKDHSVIGKPIFEAVPELKNRPCAQMFAKAWLEGETFKQTAEPALVDINGEHHTLYFDFEYLPVKDASGKIIAVMNSAIDVTEQVLKNQALKMPDHYSNNRQEVPKLSLDESEKLVTERLNELAESEERFRLMAEGTELLISVSDEYNKRIYFNKQWEKVTGRKIDDLIANGWMDLIHPDEKSLFIKNYGEACSRHEVFTSEFRLADAKNNYRWYLCQCPPRFRSDGSFAGYMSSCLDITLRKNEELRKNEFIGTISHELRTPLTSLNGFIQIMKAKLQTLDRSYLEIALNKAQNQVNKMSAMINSFLDISRLESGRMEIHKQLFRLDEVIREIIDEFSFIQRTHKIEFESTCTFKVFADQNKISAVMSNLISNSVKYAPFGTTVKINCREYKDSVMVCVSDDGPGIESSELKRIFERYYRSKTSPTISGFGIGLYLCLEIISKHGGEIWAESILGQGAKFYFTLPKA